MEERVYKLESTIRHLLPKGSEIDLDKLVEASNDKRHKLSPRNYLASPRIQPEFSSEASRAGASSIQRKQRHTGGIQATEISTAVMSSTLISDTKAVTSDKVNSFLNYENVKGYVIDEKSNIRNPLEIFGKSTSLFLCKVFNIDKKLKSEFFSDSSDTSDYSTSASSLLCMDDFIDAYFENIHDEFPIVSENHFRKQYMESKSTHSPASWKVFFNIVSAIGAWSCKGPGTAEASFYEASKLLLNGDVFETANYETVTSLALFSYYAYKKFRYDISWVYLGMATRAAISMGIPYTPSSVDTATNNTPPADLHDRIWQNLISIDFFLSILYSRPCSIPSHIKYDYGSSLMLVDEEEKSKLWVEFPACNTLMTIGLLRNLSSVISEKALCETLSASQARQLCQDIDEFVLQHSSSSQLDDNFESKSKTEIHFVWKMTNIQVILTQSFLFGRIMQNFGSKFTESTDSMASLRPVTVEELECQIICLQKSSHILKTAEQFMNIHKNRISILGSWGVLNAIHMASLIPVIYYTCYELILQDWSCLNIQKSPPTQKSIKEMVDLSMLLLEKLTNWHFQPSTKLLHVFQTMLEDTVVSHTEDDDSVSTEFGIKVETVLGRNCSELDISKPILETSEMFGSIADCFGFFKPTLDPIDAMSMEEQGHQW